ncbi:outer membrane beta-barrel protein [Chitinimonas sp. PSY-7]|uniref:outer membrane beta-barrel protein n=1 Tax=Chitinimonas sp. PSY-7 TaxID=3459088 RepID=UPI0040402794
MYKLKLLHLTLPFALGAFSITATAANTYGGEDNAKSYSWIPYTSYGYVGVNLGKSNYDAPCQPLFDCKNPKFGGKIYTGGLFSRVFGMEVGYVNVGKADRNGGQSKAHGANISLVGNLPIGDKFNVFGKVGGTYGWTKTTASPLLVGYQTGKHSGAALTYGAGLGFDIDRQNQILLEWDRQKFKFKDGDHAVNLYTAGWKYKF